MPNFDPEREELEHVAGDEPNGKLGTFDLTQGAIGRVRVRYGDTIIFCEVYQNPGEPMQIHWKCPRCLSGGPRNMTRITGDRKRIEYDPRSQLDDGGRLNVEAFECPWDLGYVQAGGPRRSDFGISMCKLTIAIDNSRAREV